MNRIRNVSINETFLVQTNEEKIEKNHQRNKEKKQEYEQTQDREWKTQSDITNQIHDEQMRSTSLNNLDLEQVNRENLSFGLFDFDNFYDEQMVNDILNNSESEQVNSNSLDFNWIDFDDFYDEQMRSTSLNNLEFEGDISIKNNLLENY